ncbi:MAG: DegT/DnrJ/EryC1/StrS family aminotransferase [Verrucomicrobia bacterium]|nr:DegT/DnrJ/EryC1/StrS family aminotransferase [Verrucomicrobiota bacterium]
MRHGTLTQGPKIAEFEREFAVRVGARYALAVSSGTAALHLACMAAGVGPRQRVVTSPITFVASANCARYVGADVVFSDIDVATLNLAPATLERCLSQHDHVAAIIPVRLRRPAVRHAGDKRPGQACRRACHRRCGACAGRHAAGRVEGRRLQAL